MTIKPFLVDGNLVVNEATITNSGTSIVLPSNSHFSGGGNIFNVATNTTDDITQGTTNLYYTNTKADARADLRISAASITALSDADQTVQTTDNVTFNNITTTGYLAGPATLTIDPAAVGDNTGTVVIAGNLQVDGTTTTINSTTLTVDDKNIVLASGAGNGSAADGAGITIDGASATMLYTHATTSFDFNKPLNISGDLTLISSDVGSADDPTLDLYRNSASPANADDIGHILFSGEDAGGNKVSYAQINSRITDVSNGVADGRLNISSLINNNLTTYYSAAFSQNQFFLPLYLANNANSITFEGATADAHETILTVTDPTADRTVTLPDATGTVMLNVVEDTTPQLGGTLDTNSNDIDFNGASKLILDADADTTISSINVGGAPQDDTIIFKMENYDAVAMGHGASGTGQAGHTILKLFANNSDQYAGAKLQLYKNSSSPAVNDYGGAIEFMDNDSAGNQTVYASVVSNAQNVSDGTEEGSLYYFLNKNGTSVLSEGILYNAHYFANKQTLKWYQHTSTYDLDLATPATITAARTITLPDATGHIPVFTTAPTSAITDGTAGQVLQTNGSGALSFVDQAEGAVGGGTDKTFLETDNSVNTSYTISTNRNAMTTGPVTVNSGATVTVPSGQRWVIL